MSISLSISQFVPVCLSVSVSFERSRLRAIGLVKIPSLVHCDRRRRMKWEKIVLFPSSTASVREFIFNDGIAEFNYQDLFLHSTFIDTSGAHVGAGVDVVADCFKWFNDVKAAKPSTRRSDWKRRVHLCSAKPLTAE